MPWTQRRLVAFNVPGRARAWTTDPILGGSLPGAGPPTGGSDLDATPVLVVFMFALKRRSRAGCDDRFAGEYNRSLVRTYADGWAPLHGPKRIENGRDGGCPVPPSKQLA